MHAYGKQLVHNAGSLHIVDNIDRLDNATDSITQTIIAVWNPRTEQPCTSIPLLGTWLLFLSPINAPELQFILNVSLSDVLKRAPHLFGFGKNITQNSSTSIITTTYNTLKNKTPLIRVQSK